MSAIIYFYPMPTQTIPGRRALRFMLSYMKRYLPSLLAGILLLMVVDTFQLIIPRIVRSVIDRLGGENLSRALILKSSLSIAALALGMTFLRFFYRICLFLPARRIEKEIRDDLFGHCTRLPLSYFNRTKTGDLMALFVNDLNAIRMATGMGLVGMTDAIFLGSMSIVFMLTIDIKLTLVTVAPLPVIALGMVKFGGRIQARYKEVQETFATVSSLSQEAFSGIRSVKGFVQERAELASFSSRCDDYVHKNIRLVRLWGFLFPAIGFFGSISFGILFLYGGLQVIRGSLSLGSFVSFTFYIQLLLWPIMAFGWVYNILQRGIASAKRVLELTETDPERTAAGDRPFKAWRASGGIMIRNLTFRYEGADRDALRKIDLELPPGGSLGIIGKPGSGKTTLVSLLFHLYPLGLGKLFIDGMDINDIPLAALRKSIGYVPQDSFLFSDTIEGNIAFGIEGGPPGRGEIERVARTAAIDRDIARFPDGYSTVIGERGITLSGGQKQRLAIARAIILNPSILILDDALSSVDAGTERKILSGLREELAGRTSIVIAHRISTVRGCDSIIVLDQGAVTERGTHDELVTAGGFYARLHALQAASGGEDRK